MFSQETLNNNYQKVFKKSNHDKLNSFLIEKNFVCFDSIETTIEDINVKIYTYSNKNEVLKLFYCTGFKNTYEIASGLFNDTSKLTKTIIYSINHEYTNYKINNKYYSFLFKDNIN
tara:strand:+ start:113 stop:460 length:348 start_codon:yes stop_codon:yes gene_type:complete